MWNTSHPGTDAMCFETKGSGNDNDSENDLNP